MSVLRMLLAPERRYSLADLDRDMSRLVSGVPTATGVTVSEESALSCVAVYACVRVISETVASLPLHVYRRMPDGGKQRDPKHPLYGLLHDQPNPEITTLEYREMLLGHVLLWGNHYSEIERDQAGRVKALWPLRPDRMRSVTWGPDNRLIYEYRLPDGTVKLFTSDLILRVPGLSSNGITGYSPIGFIRQAIGLSLAAEEYGGRFFGNDSRPGGVLKMAGKLGAEAKARLKADWEEAHQPLSRKYRVAVLEEGLEWQTIGVPPEEAQFLQVRKFQVEEIARFFRIPPHKIGAMENATYSNIETQKNEFVSDTIRPWCVRIEQRLNYSLLSQADRATWFVEHVLDGLLRGDIQARYSAYQTGRNWGWLSANDVREIENLNPLPPEIGNVYLAPLNMVPADQLSSPAATAPVTVVPPAPVGARAVRAAAPEPGPASRRRILEHYYPLLLDTAGRLVQREVQDVGAQAAKALARRGAADVETWLGDYYARYPTTIEKIWQPVLRTYAKAILDDAAAEVGAAFLLSVEDEDFVRLMGDKFAGAYAERSLAQMQTVLREAIAAGEDPLVAIERRLGEWATTKAEKTAQREGRWANNATTHHVYQKAGITRTVWTAYGKSCPFCTRLNGKTAGINQVFLAAGETIEGDAGGTPFAVNRRFKYPPLHAYCDCYIRPG